MRERMLFITVLLFAELALAVTSGALPSGWPGRLGMAAALLLPLLFLKHAPAGTTPLRFAFGERRKLSVLWLLPLFILVTALTSLAFGEICRLIGIPLRESAPLASLPLAILLDAALPALCEELFCRGALFSVLRPMGRRTAVFGSALLFSLMHLNLAQLPYAFVAGVLLALLYEWSGSLLLPMLFHLGNNLVSLSLFFGFPGEYFFPSLLLASLLGLLLFLRVACKLPRLSREGWGEPFPLRGFFLSPLLLWLSIALCITLL